MELFRKNASALLNHCLPHYCPCCQTQAKQWFCDPCLSGLPTLSQGCLRCDLPLTGETHTFCAECQANEQSFDRIVCAYEYMNDVKHAIADLKHSANPMASNMLNQALLKCLLQHSPNWPDIIIPVPIHWRTRLKRGFNQADIIANYLAKALAIPRKRFLKKKRLTKAQKVLSRTQREKNLTHAYFASKQLSAHKSVAIVDDIVTTCATANVLAKLVKAQGVEEVQIWALARTPKT